MKQIIITFAFIISLLSIASGVSAQNLQEEDFKKTCEVLLQNMAKKDLHGINQLINSTYGVYILYRQGIYDQFENQIKLTNTISFSLEYLDVKKTDLKKYKLNYGRLPSYDCGESVWNKRGFFTDAVKHYQPVSIIAGTLFKYLEVKTSKKELARIKFIEQHSRKVIFTGTKGDGCIFYLSWLNGKWYLSIIDNVTMDCSA